jgi:hypothetical protein
VSNIHKFMSTIRLIPAMPWRIARIQRDIATLSAAIDAVRLAVGRIEAQQKSALSSDLLHDYEFQVYSQWGEDGIIQFLLRNIPIERRIFVEFGVQDYKESNTRFLLQNNYWSGLVIDSSQEDVRDIVEGPLYWKYNLKAECALITSTNVDPLLTMNGIPTDIGLLSIDIDGNDYWVWRAIRSVSPRIVVCEYNSLFGPVRKVTIPHDDRFVRAEAHFSYLYRGASIAALDDLARTRGYSLVGSNSAGNNAFFARNDVVGKLPTLSPEEAYVRAGFRESRDSGGQLDYLDFDESFARISHLPVYDLDLDRVVPVSDLESRE